ncbi:unnamed protein product [Musa acuminata subsp. malaccensis]|uniref:(wild Malaysian banana) hypothetical protein n=1 Tax=Musa acuminata subsp. malaccensis TaxID=214687 RepID=A0A804JDS3_MUSAM|nr:unnamed protein product [Musa acuminata subsp. malaccensis]
MIAFKTGYLPMIAASLRSCSIGRSGGVATLPLTPAPLVAAHLLEASDESSGEVMVELNSDTALPYRWEQRLDMRTGEVYYINLETGTKTRKDPRTAVIAAATYSSSYISGKEISSSDDSCSRVGGSEDYESSVDTANSCLSSLSSSSPPDTVADPGGAQILVAAGCRSCFMYFMVPKSVDACPKCGGGLLHLGRYGCV